MEDNKKLTSNYGADDIQLLEGLEGVRKRPGCIGSTNCYINVWEVATDEAMNGFGEKISVTILKNGAITIADEGRGFQLELINKRANPAINLVFEELHAGGKFGPSNYKTSAGLHGVGASVTNALSSWIDITVYREGKVHHLRYEDGGKLVTPLEVIGTTNKNWHNC